MKSILALFLFVICAPLAGQTSFEELEFEIDSSATAYRPSGKNYVFLRSKRGSNGLNKTATADAIIAAEVTEIVLVFSELNSSAIAEREEANQERWENLLRTYPEYFQYSTTYKNICQCNNNGDSALFKQKQGFYVYVTGEVPKAEEPKVVAASAPPAAAKVPETPTPSKPVKSPEKEIAAVATTAVITKEAPIKEVHEVAPTKEVAAPPAKEVQEEAEAAAPEVVKESPRKKTASAKPRRSSDPKACRQPCYGFGDEDFFGFFKDNMSLTKKERRKAKNWVANVRLQIHFDGSIKKVMVTGTNTDFNQKVEVALKGMSNWNAAVKNGLAVKSEVRFTLKYDKESKALKPFDVVMNPRLAPKCKCVSDSEIFSD
ncbi:MAG: hypothetical protein PSX36_09380 [bacterium]|nr:hypothetical protein [bacterium]